MIYMRKLISYFTCILFISITLNSCTSSNFTIDEEIKSLTSSNAKTYTIKQLRQNVFLKNDSIYNKSDKTPYSGTIQVLGKYNYIKPDGEISEKQAITAIFNIVNGSFSGEQLYSNVASPKKRGLYSVNGHIFFIKTKIIPDLDMIEGKDYEEVNEGEPSDWNIPYFGRKRYYKIINHKEFSPIDISIFWGNGNLFYESTYSFNYLLYCYAQMPFSSNKKELFVDDTKTERTVSIYHYNGTLAYKGPIQKEKIATSGSFYDFSGNKVNSTNFFIPRGEGKDLTSDKFRLSIPDGYYKCYRDFF